MKKKCHVCKKKISCIEYICKCNKLFCITHYTPESHQCSYDFKKEAHEQLRKEMMVGKLVDMERV